MREAKEASMRASCRKVAVGLLLCGALMGLGGFWGAGESGEGTLTATL